MTDESVHTGTLASLIELLSSGTDALDEHFARDLARRLHSAADRLSLPVVESFGMEDVVATFYMDRKIRLVVTGNLIDCGGSVQLGWDEHDFPRVPITLHPEPRESGYTFATLDFSVRGREGRLLENAGKLPAGWTVTVRALATIGDVEEYRIRADGIDASVAPDNLELTPLSDA